MNTLVKFIGNDVFTDSMVIAEGTGNQHESVVSLIKTHQKSLKKFGNIRFTDLKSGNPKGGRPTRIYQLNEPQATLLVTFSPLSGRRHVWRVRRTDVWKLTKSRCWWNMQRPKEAEMQISIT